MRYVINDDDLEDWIRLLVLAVQTEDWSTLPYVIGEMNNETREHFADGYLDHYLALLPNKELRSYKD
jgi:hypothetical protein